MTRIPDILVTRAGASREAMSVTNLRFQLLGTMLINGLPASELLPGVRARQLLATLLQHPNRYVACDTLADNLWDAQPPKSAAANLRTHVGAVRRGLSAAEVPARIDTRPGGYQISVSPQSLDTTRMDELLVEARHLAEASEPTAAGELAEEALSLWRGSPLEGLPVCSAWAPQITRWEMLHADALDLAVGLHLEHGDPWRAARMVRDRLTDDRYEESAWCQLVRCYLAGGMPTEAARALDEARSVLADELGAEPGPELLELEGQIRTDAPGPDQPLPPAQQQAEHSAAQGPCQLPYDPADFCGRSDEIERTIALLAQRPVERPSVLIVTGPPGVGKTTFVTHAAHQLRDTYPDGQIYLDLRGTTTPLSAPFAITEVLSTVGVASPSDDLGRAAALLRSELASRRMLLVADNAASAEQLLPLLPGTGDSAVLVTSRRRLTGITGAAVIDLDVLSTDDACEMVGRIAGLSDPDDQLQLAEACGRHPLAIRIASGRLTRRPDLSVRALASRLADPTRALNELTLGEIAFSSSAQLSCTALEDRVGAGLRTLGSLEVGEFSGFTVEVAAGGPAGVDRLLEENLLQVDRTSTGQVSYVLHDLLRFHTRAWAESLAEDTSDGVRQLLGRWLAASGRASRALPSNYFGPQLDLPSIELDPATATEIDDPAGAWFDRERQRLDAMITSAIRHDCVDLAWRLAVSWSPYFDLRGHTRAWASALETAYDAVRASGDPVGHASVLRDLGQVRLYRDDLTGAAAALSESRDLFLSAQESIGAAYASIGLAVVDNVAESVDRTTLTRCSEALDWFCRAEHPPGIAAAHNATAMVYLAWGQLDDAEPELVRAADACRAAGDRHREAQVMRRFGELHDHRGESETAERSLTAALEIFLDLGDHRCAGYASTRLGRLHLSQGDTTAARRQFREALAAGRRQADPAAQAAAWSAMAETLDNESERISCLQRSVRAWQVADRPEKAAEESARLERRPPGRRSP